MNPALIAGAVQGIGKLIGGGRQNKYAKRYRAEAQAAADEAIMAVQREKEEVKALRADDEARLKAATGYNFQKLRDQAIKAGFNPLTVLQATGGAGYDGRGAVLTTPFVSSEGAYARRLDANIATAGAVIGSAGYVGEAIQAAGTGYFDQRNAEAQLEQERLRTDLMRAEFINAPNGGGSGFTPFGAPVRGVTASPVAYHGAGPSAAPPVSGEPPMEVNPASSEYLWKKVRTGIPGYDAWVYNDEASESEIASSLSVLTIPVQMFGQWVKPYLTDEQGEGYAHLAARKISEAWARGLGAAKDADPAFAGKPAWDTGDMVFRLGR